MLSKSIRLKNSCDARLIRGCFSLLRWSVIKGFHRDVNDIESLVSKSRRYSDMLWHGFNRPYNAEKISKWSCEKVRASCDKVFGPSDLNALLKLLYLRTQELQTKWNGGTIRNWSINLGQYPHLG